MGWLDRILGKKKPSPTHQASTPGPSDAGSSAPIPPDDKPPLPSKHLKLHMKTAWLWGLADGEGDMRVTRVGGRPVMGPTETWPTCGACKKALTLMIQCNLNDLPEAMGNHGGGLLRAFYCMQEDCVGMGGWDAFDPQHHLSVLTADGDFRDVPENTPTFSPRHLSALKPVDDYPHWEDRQSLDTEELTESDDDIGPHAGHKFAGWPYWIQGAERPNCPKCQAEMLPFIQLDEDISREFNFGGGIGHISQCKTHLDVFAFGWACG